MAVDNRHPEYHYWLPQWIMMRDCMEGEHRVKAQGQLYLPKTESMMHNLMSGDNEYRAYKMRAVYYNYVADAVLAMLGLLHREDATIELPEKMEYLREKATPEGETLLQLLGRINREQLLIGRLGLLPDLPRDETMGVPQPYIAMYGAEKITHWIEKNEAELLAVVLNETKCETNPDTFENEEIEKYRVLRMGDGGYTVSVQRKNISSDNTVQFIEEETVIPAVYSRNIDKIPFVFVNASDTLHGVECPPLIGLASLCLAIYRGEADYRQNLFMQSQDLLLVKERAVQGVKSKPLKVGAGSTLHLSPEGDAKYVGVTANGLQGQETALENLKADARNKAGQFVTSAQKESGEAMSIRIGAQTAMLTQIAFTGAMALEKVLKHIAEWIGADPEKVKVTPNYDFKDDTISGSDLKEFWACILSGAPISRESFHAYIRSKGLTVMNYDEELEKIEEERDSGMFENSMEQVDNGTADNQSTVI